MTETFRNYKGCICKNEWGEIGIVSHMMVDVPGHRPWEGLILANGCRWVALHPVVVAENIDEWVAIRVEELLGLEVEKEYPSKKNLLT